MSSERPAVLFLVGPTASGKSSAGLAVAERLGGEILGCDSMQVYRGFDIGTDKPSAEDRARVPHHLVDVVDAGTQFTAADFASLAAEAIAGISARGRLPLVVGGTGLYFKALEDGLFPGPGRDAGLRRTLEEEARAVGVEALWLRLQTVDPAYAAKTGRRDRVRIIRALEVHALTGLPLSEHFRRTQGRLSRYRVVKIGLRWPRPELVRRIERRVDGMFARGLVGEVENLLARGVPETAPPFRALGYKYVRLYLRGEIGLPAAVEGTKTETRRYSKRQMTWFRRLADVRWVDAPRPEDVLAAAADALEG